MFVSESTSRPNRKCTPFPSDGARLRSDRLDLLGLISSLGTVFRCFARYSLPVTTPFTSCPWTTLSSARPFSPTTSLTRVKNSCGYLYLEKEANTRVDDKNVDCCISAAQTDNVNKLSDRKYGKRIFGRVLENFWNEIILSNETDVSSLRAKWNWNENTAHSCSFNMANVLTQQVFIRI